MPSPFPGMDPYSDMMLRLTIANRFRRHPSLQKTQPGSNSCWQSLPKVEVNRSTIIHKGE
jgi:hypothetical protein